MFWLGGGILRANWRRIRSSETGDFGCDFGCYFACYFGCYLGCGMASLRCRPIEMLVEKVEGTLAMDGVRAHEPLDLAAVGNS